MGGPTVLIVEDDPSLRLLCRVNLELEGLNVLEAETLAQAIALVAGEPIDVVLLDLHVGEDLGLGLLPYLHESRPRRLRLPPQRHDRKRSGAARRRARVHPQAVRARGSHRHRAAPARTSARAALIPISVAIFGAGV